MRSMRLAHRAFFAIAIGLVAARPAAAQWTPVASVPATLVYSLAAREDTLLAGVDDAVYASFDGGVSWTRSANVGPIGVRVTAVHIERGLLWAGTYGQGVWTSADHGASWQNASTGLVGGIFNSQAFIEGFVTRGDSLYAGTSGAGVYVMNLATMSPWSVFGPSLVSSASGTVNGFAGEGQRILAGASPNGILYFNDRGHPEWTEVVFEPQGAGLEADDFAWTGSAWLAASGIGIYRSATGAGDWQRTGPDRNSGAFAQVVSANGRTFASFSGLFNVDLYFSPDGGGTWAFLETEPAQFADMVLRGDELFAARGDGVWRRVVATVDVGPPSSTAGVAFALASSNPARGVAAVRFALPAGGRVRVTALDLTGRTVATLADGPFPAGDHRVTWDALDQPPGIYFLRLEAAGVRRSLRVVMLH